MVLVGLGLAPVTLLDAQELCRVPLGWFCDGFWILSFFRAQRCFLGDCLHWPFVSPTIGGALGWVGQRTLSDVLACEW